MGLHTTPRRETDLGIVVSEKHIDVRLKRWLCDHTRSDQSNSTEVLRGRGP